MSNNQFVGAKLQTIFEEIYNKNTNFFVGALY